MATFNLPGFGPMNLAPISKGYWETQIEVPTGPVAVDINTNRSDLPATLLDRVAKFLADGERFDQLARTAISTDYTSADSASAHFLSHHVDDFSPEERVLCFGTNDAQAIGVAQLQASIRLNRVGLYPDEPDRIAVFDYSFRNDMTDYVLAIEFDSNDRVIRMAMES
jgi:hypothetical protein